MFLDALTPMVKEVASQPIAFMGGFVSGLLRINLSEDPVKSWLDQQTGSASSADSSEKSDKPEGPQSITIE